MAGQAKLFSHFSALQARTTRLARPAMTTALKPHSQNELLSRVVEPIGDVFYDFCNLD